MNQTSNTFQIVLFIVLGVGLALGLLVFSGVIKTSPKKSDTGIVALGNISMWGPFINQDIITFTNSFNNQNKESVLTYTGFDEDVYDTKLLEAFASGKAPDLIILPHTLISRYADKVIILSEEVLPERNFKDLYSQGAEVFRTPAGTIGLPFAVDPLVMYYNRDIIESAGFINPPSFWNEDFIPFVEKITKIGNDGLTVLVSGAPLGEATNVKNFPALFSALTMQLGSPMVVFKDTIPVAVFKEASSITSSPGVSALEYVVDFADPTNKQYSWNKSLPEARDAFALGTSAVYFGFSSELLEIQKKNPNLNFDVVQIPQIKEINKSLTYGNFYALAVPKTSLNTSSAFSIAGALATGVYTSEFIQTLKLQSVRRDILSTIPTGTYQKVFHNSAIIARGWYSPNPFLISKIFTDMVSSVNSGNQSPDRAILEASEKINEAF